MIYVNGSPLNVTLFPDNTSQVWKVAQIDIPDTNWVMIRWEFSHEGEFLHLAQLKDLLDARGFRCALRIKYLPYGRQDKEISNEATFGLRTFATLLNSLGFEEIKIIDPHSPIATDLIKNSVAVYPYEAFESVLKLLDPEVLCYPDKGARTKYDELLSLNFIYGEKVREQSTGKITDYKLVGSPKGKSVLIVDDICDGGATFIMLADALIAEGASDVNLFVTHGLFSKGLKVLKESGINRIFTQDGEASEIQQHIAYRRL
jgi:ribose-phosphate pyrophosphokinase